MVAMPPAVRRRDRSRGPAAWLVALLIWVASAAGASERLENGYAAAPLTDPIFTSEQIATEIARLNNWLIENHAKLDPERRQSVREALYSLLSSYVAQRHTEGKPLLPLEDDLLMRTVFSWAEPLGVYGAHHVYNELVARSGLENVPEMPALVPLPESFTSSLEGDLLLLRSARGGWSVRFPFWFMPFAIAEFDTKNGPRTQLVMLGTGTIRHDGLPGHSQSTIRLFVGPGQVGGGFESYWRKALGFETGSERVPIPIDGLSSRKRFDEEAKIHSEMVSWAGNNGPILVYYAGAPGPYEKNREHFFDFIRSLRGAH
ncbi:MAG: hypothetical protein NXI30_10350 [bacterium]|nr:hypothetical protein [bacterium]